MRITSQSRNQVVLFFASSSHSLSILDPCRPSPGGPDRVQSLFTSLVTPLKSMSLYSDVYRHIFRDGRFGSITRGLMTSDKRTPRSGLHISIYVLSCTNQMRNSKRSISCYKLFRTLIESLQGASSVQRLSNPKYSMLHAPSIAQTPFVFLPTRI